MKKAIGIDIGGTKISIISGTERGKILAQEIIPTLTGSQTRRGVESLVKATADVIERTGGRFEGIGVGIPGPVDTAKGVVPRSPHLNGWAGLPLGKILKSHLKLPVLMGNDANAAALGEKNFGQGRGKKDFIYVTVSTGIGSGIIIDGKLLEGTTFVAGEAGHMTIVPDGAPCKCGKRGCWEAYGSGTAIARMAREKYGKNLRKKFGPKPVSAKDVAGAARQGDRTALGIYQESGFYLGLGLANLLNILNPQMIILGGGVWNSAPRDFWNAMMKSCKRDAWPQAFGGAKIVRSNLGGHSGDLGALALGFEARR